MIIASSLEKIYLGVVKVEHAGELGKGADGTVIVLQSR